MLRRSTLKLHIPALALTLIGLMLQSADGGAQERRKVEIVPNIPHSLGIKSAAFSPDGTRLLSGSQDKTVKLWDAATGRLLRTFEGHSDAVASVAFSPDGARVLSGSHDQTLKLWDTVSGQLIRTFEGHRGMVTSVAFSPDGARLLSGSWDDTLKLWDAATGQSIRTFNGHSATVTSVAFSPDGRRVISGSQDKTVKLWDTATGAVLHTFAAHTRHVESVTFSPDGMRLLSGGSDSAGDREDTLRLWDAATGQLIRAISSPALSVTFSPDGTRLLSGGARGARLWDAASGQLIHSFTEHELPVYTVAFSPDGTRLLSGAEHVRLWDAASGQLIHAFKGVSGSVQSVASSPDGKHLVSGSSDKTLKLWDAASGQLVRTFTGHSKWVRSVAFSPDGTRLLSGSEDKTLKLWDAASGQVIQTLGGHSRSADSVAFSPDGTRLLSGGPDKTVKLWDASSGQLMRTFEAHTNWVNSVAFSPDGTRLLTGSGVGDAGDQTLKLWDIATGQLIHAMPTLPYAVRAVAFSPDGARLLSGSNLDKAVKLWDATSGQLIRTFTGHSGPVDSVAFSPDGARVLSGSWDKTVRLWETASGSLIHTFEGHSGWVNSAAFSADGARILSGSNDTTVRIWSTASGQPLAMLFAGESGEWLAMTPEGFFNASAKGAGMLSIVRGLEVTTIDQVHQSLFNPDLVRESLAGDPSGEVRDAAKVINLGKTLDSGPAPAVSITSTSSDGNRSGGDLATVTARIEGRGKGIGRIEWRVNGITVAVAAKPPGSGPAHTVSQQLALDPGDNTIEVVAYNASNLLASLPARTTIKFTGPADQAKPKLHILGIGINDYIDKGWTPPGSAVPLAFAPLGLAVKDAQAFAVSLKEAVAGIYDEVRVTLALDEQATHDNLEKLIGKVSAHLHPRDSFVLFAAGHGTTENGRFYFIPQDYQGGSGHLAQRAIGQDRLQDWLANRIKARRAIILLDTCESGALVAGHARSRADGPASDAAVGRLHEATGRPVLTAAAAGQFAHEGLIGVTGERHGVFTWALLDALRKGDSNGNGLIELSELVRHVQSVVPKIAADLGGAGRAATSEPAFGKQAARFGSRGEDFVVAQQLR
jgi:WD40 repeat protein